MDNSKKYYSVQLELKISRPVGNRLINNLYHCNKRIRKCQRLNDILVKMVKRRRNRLFVCLCLNENHYTETKVSFLKIEERERHHKLFTYVLPIYFHSCWHLVASRYGSHRWYEPSSHYTWHDESRTISRCVLFTLSWKERQSKGEVLFVMICKSFALFNDNRIVSVTVMEFIT